MLPKSIFIYIFSNFYFFDTVIENRIFLWYNGKYIKKQGLKDKYIISFKQRKSVIALEALLRKDNGK